MCPTTADHIEAKTDSRGPHAVRLRRKIRFVLLYALFIVVLLEVAARLYWTIGYGVSFLTPDLFYAFYPEIKRIESAPRDTDNSAFDVLLLGGSVLQRDWSNIPILLGQELKGRTKHKVRIYNPSRQGHTSRDSWLKYQRLQGRRFDLILFYHGINEARANNCPPDMFRDDYNHYAWYARFNDLMRHRESRYVVLPYTSVYLATTIAEHLGLVRRVPEDIPNDEWTRFGAQVKTVEPFRHNLTRILELARHKDEPVILMTFATDIRPDETIEQFAQRPPNFTGTALWIGVWGEARHVAAAVQAHNGVIKQLAEQYGTFLVDQDSLIPKRRQYFNDPCHLTKAGSERFVANVLDVAVKVMRRRL